MAALGLLVICGCAWQVAGAQNQPDFNREVRPILADKCFACHGPDEAERQAGLRLDTRAGALSEAESDAAIVPGKPDESPVWQRIVAAPDEGRMPPPDSHKELSDPEKEILRRWIESGAPYQQHWSFEPIRPISPPVVSGYGNPIDAFIVERLQREGLTPSPPADRARLLRRLSFALTGLPPSREELERWEKDLSPAAWESMVDHYLGSPHYGEEMARHWLDLARYADTHGLHLDNERQMWAYRDWVVNSFNRNQSFDQFTVEQLAGDLLPKPSLDQLIATGFNRCNVTTSEGGAIDDEFRFRYAVDRASTMSATWMGLTAGCAVCHDHKFDPISAREFYSLYAFFNSAADPAMDGNALLTQPVLKLESESDRQRLADWDRQIAEAGMRLDQAVAGLTYEDPASVVPAPAAAPVELVWMEDDFPEGGSPTSGPGHPAEFVSTVGTQPVFSGQRAWKRSDEGLSQDVWEGAPTPLTIPANGRFFVHVYLDPERPPKSIMLQYFRNGWLHRAVWGAYDLIPWGATNTTERVLMGELPATGSWVRLEVPTERIGLSPGDAITGFATTQFGGTVYWDKLGVSGDSSPATDPQLSFRAWWKSVEGKDVADLPPDLPAIAKAGPDANAEPALAGKLRDWYLTRICQTTRPALQSQVAELERLKNERKGFHEAIPSTFIYRDLDQPRESFVMLRGMYNQPGEKVLPGVPAVFPPLELTDPGRPANRLDLAKWLLAPEHPLTARVAVNRIWQQLFGIGLVKSSGDFGTQGDFPSHPELLDWLATHFRESGWDVKGLVRLIVTSQTFRQSSRVSPELLERDPENRLLARGPRLRLDAEQIRDNVLYVSGLLDPTPGGKGVKPYQPDNIWEPVGYTDSNTRHYRRDDGAALYRRSLYTFFKRTAPPPFMANFDAPNREQPCTRRERSNTPLQALQLLNDVQHVEAARALAQQALTPPGLDDDSRLTFLFRTVLARPPEADESAVLLAQLQEHRLRYAASPEDAGKLIRLGESKPDGNLPPDQLAAWTLLTSTLLNLDETLNRN